ncbi:MAG TPA: rhamnulokinase, partial [Bacilli bacterium]
PTEATAIGNIMMQAMAHGEVRDVTQIRQVVIDSFPPEVYSPKEEDVWQEAYGEFVRVCAPRH